MTQRLLQTFLVAVLLAWLATDSLRAQSTLPSLPGIHVYENASAKVDATHVRMFGTIKTSHGDARRALEALRELREKASQKLKELKADEASIEFSETEIGNFGNENAQMEVFFEMGMGPEVDGSESKLPLFAQSTVIADWEIPESDNDAKILFLKRLEEKIEQMDVLGANQELNLSEEQAAIMEKMAQMGGPAATSGKPSVRFQFVGVVTPEQKKFAMKKATENGAQNATAMAESMGVKCGKVLSVTAAPVLSDAFSYYPRRGVTFPTKSNEVTSKNPSTLQYSTKLAISYEIEQAKE